MNWRQSSITHHDLTIAVQEHGPDDGYPFLALHGWQDNSSSFAPLADLLGQFRFIAMDFPGHGLSDWRHLQAGYYVWQYVQDVRAVWQARLGDQRYTLLGHSMGGAVACLFAALFPENIDRLILLDVVGPLATEAGDAPEQMRRAIEQFDSDRRLRRRYYPDLESAIAARTRKGLSLEAAELLAVRGVRQDDKGWYWGLDPRLTMPNQLSFSEAHSEAFMRQVKCPVLLISAPGYWEHCRDWFRQRQSYFASLETHELDGGHHQHMEEHAGRIAELIRDFVER